MTQNDITLVVLIVLCLVLLDYSGMRIWDSVSAETELTAEWNLLEQQAAGSDCQKEPGCGSATWKLTLQAKKSDVSKALAAVRHDKRRAVYEVLLTLFGLIFILLLYPELWSVLRSRLGIKPQQPPQTATP